MSHNQPPPPSGYPTPGGPPPGGSQQSGPPSEPQAGSQPAYGAAPPPPTGSGPGGAGGPGGPNAWGGSPVGPPPQRKRKGALIAAISGGSVLVLALAVGGVVWSQSQDSRDAPMVPYTLSLPHKILHGDYYKKKDLPTICSHSDCLTSEKETDKMGIKKAFPWSGSYVPSPGGPGKRSTITVTGIQGRVTKPTAAVDAALARMHKDDEKNAKTLGAKIEVIEGTKKTGWKGDTFDGTIMMCESIMIVPKRGLDKEMTVTRCVWGDTSAVGIVQQQGVGIKSDVMDTHELNDATLMIRNEMRQPHPA
ncbi:hypothetical protein ACWCV5_16620 [Streptomyces tubercidicus]